METALLPIAGIAFFILMLGLVAAFARLASTNGALEGGISHADRRSAEDHLSNDWGWRGTAARQSAKLRKAKVA